MADRVMRGSQAQPSAASAVGSIASSASTVQAKCDSCEEQEATDDELSRATIQRKPVAASDGSLPVTALPSYRPRVAIPPKVQRACQSCEEEEQQQLQRKEAGSNAVSGEVSSGFQSRLSSLRSGGGRALPETTRSFMERGFGHDFSGVRIHADSGAASLSKAVGAKAFTVGQDVVFGTGMYQPETFEGKKLLAHELAHTVQQAKGQAGSGVQRELLQRMTEDEVVDEVVHSARIGQSPNLTLEDFTLNALRRMDKRLDAALANAADDHQREMIQIFIDEVLWPIRKQKFVELRRQNRKAEAAAMISSSMDDPAPVEESVEPADSTEPAAEPFDFAAHAGETGSIAGLPLESRQHRLSRGRGCPATS